MDIVRLLRKTKVIVEVRYAKGEKCICCEKIYDKKATETKEFSNMGDSEGYMTLLKFLKSRTWEK